MVPKKQKKESLDPDSCAEGIPCFLWLLGDQVLFSVAKGSSADRSYQFVSHTMMSIAPLSYQRIMCCSLILVDHVLQSVNSGLHATFKLRTLCYMQQPGDHVLLSTTRGSLAVLSY